MAKPGLLSQAKKITAEYEQKKEDNKHEKKIRKKTKKDGRTKT